MSDNDFLDGVETDNPITGNTKQITSITLHDVDLNDKPNLKLANLNDSDLITPIKVSELTEHSVPLKPLPPDAVADIIYTSRIEPRCVLCRCPFRTQAEHWYVQNAFKPMEVVRFFATYFNATISHEQVQNHMSLHCSLQTYAKRGLIQIATREEEVAPYIYRERELANIGVLMQIDEVQGLDCKGNVELALKKSARLESLYRSLREIARERDEAGSEVFNLFEILMELTRRMPNAESQQIIKDYTKELRKKLLDS